MTAKIATKRKPKQTVKQRLELAQKATNRAWGEGYLAGRAAKSVAPNTFVEALAREPEAEIRPSWLARMWKKVRG